MAKRSRPWRRALLIIAWIAVILFAGFAAFDLYSYTDRKSREASFHAANVERTTDQRIQAECSPLEPLDRAFCARDYYAASRQSEREEDGLLAQQYMARTTFWIALLAGLQTIIGLGGLYFVVASVDAATESAIAAKQQIETQVLAERPRLRVVNIVPGRRASRGGGSTEPIITCEVVNFGKTPAYISEYCFRFRVFTTIPAEPDYDRARSDNNFIVFPDKPEKRGPYVLMENGRELSDFPPISSNNDWEYVDKCILFYGYFVFEDAFGKVRKIGFGYRVGGLSDIELVGGDSYNYEKDEN